MLPELPGFYFDPEKNRYFPLKRPKTDPSQSSTAPSKLHSPSPKHDICGKTRIKNSELLQLREVSGKVLTLSKRKTDFQQEYQRMQASQPLVWKYEDTDFVPYNALEQFGAVIQTPQGKKETSVLLAGSTNCSIRPFEVGKVGQYLDNGVKHLPMRVWPPVIEYGGEFREGPTCITSFEEASTLLSSSVSCMKRIGGDICKDGDVSSFHQLGLVTTLGSGLSGGSAFILNLCKPLELCGSNPHRGQGLQGRFSKLGSYNCTIWTADCNSDGTKAVIGTDKGAALLNLESGRLSWVCRSNSDNLSQQLDQSGNTILCGFRNGAIVTVDVRQKQQRPFVHSVRPGQHSTKQKFKLTGNINPSNATHMSSAVCSLALLQSDDQYFLASSMDGYIKLYDRRLVQRGAVQSYEGHVNSHSQLQLGVDPSEKLLISGGEDGFVRIWCIKTGELLFGTYVSESIVGAVCWPQTGNLLGSNNERQFYDSLYEQNHSWAAWMGSRDGVFYIHGS